MSPIKLGDPTVKLWVYTRSDMAALGDAVLDALTEDPDLAPQKLRLWSPYKANLEQAKHLWRGEAAKPVGFLFGNRKRPFEIWLLAAFGIVPPKNPFHAISWSSHPIVLRKVAISRLEALFHRLISASNPYLAVGYHSDDFERQNVYRDFRRQDGSIEPHRLVGIPPDRFLPGLYWLNYFGPEPSSSTASCSPRTRFGRLLGTWSHITRPRASVRHMLADFSERSSLDRCRSARIS